MCCSGVLRVVQIILAFRLFQIILTHENLKKKNAVTVLICCSRDQDQDPKSKTDPGPRKKIGPDPGIRTDPDPDPERKIDPEKETETDPDPGKRTDLHLEGGRDQDPDPEDRTGRDPEEERGQGQEDVTDPDPGRGTGTVMTEDVMHGKGSFCDWLVFTDVALSPYGLTNFSFASF